MTSRSILTILVASVVLALIASAVSGVVYTARTSPAQNCDGPCDDWHTYGWPFDWRSDVPAWIMDNMEDTHSIGNHDENGISWMWMLWNAAVWFVALAPVMVGTAWVASRVRRLKSPPGQVQA